VKPQAGIPPTKPAPSSVLTKLGTLHNRSVDSASAETVIRSTAFSEKLRASVAERTDQILPGSSIDTSADTGSNALKRDDRLALVEELEVGPVEHKPSFDDPLFEQVEPNSGIRLKCVFLLS
jgi:minichromosome maintenance protein 10